MDNLKDQRGIAAVLLDLALDLSFGVSANNEESGAGKTRRKKDEGQKQLGPEAQVPFPAPQEARDSAARD
jgi:hypothetical protein